MNAHLIRMVSIPDSERAKMETLADSLEGAARNFSKLSTIVDQGNNDVSVREWLFGLAWDIKQVARHGTPSQGL